MRGNKLHKLNYLITAGATLLLSACANADEIFIRPEISGLLLIEGRPLANIVVLAGTTDPINHTLCGNSTRATITDMNGVFHIDSMTQADNDHSWAEFKGHPNNLTNVCFEIASKKTFGFQLIASQRKKISFSVKCNLPRPSSEDSSNDGSICDIPQEAGEAHGK